MHVGYGRDHWGHGLGVEEFSAARILRSLPHCRSDLDGVRGRSIRTVPEATRTLEGRECVRIRKALLPVYTRASKEAQVTTQLTAPTHTHTHMHIYTPVTIDTFALSHDACTLTSTPRHLRYLPGHTHTHSYIYAVFDATPTLRRPQ